MLKTIGSTGSAANPKETEDKASSNTMVNGDKATSQTNPTKEKKQAKTTKSKNLIKSKNHDFPPNSRNKEARTGFLISKARILFTQLRQAFVKTLILHHFNSEYHIRIETDTSGYAIDGVIC